MGKSTHFFGQPVYGQLIKSLDHDKIVEHANEGVHCDVKFTSAATNDSFMLAPNHFRHDEIVALDRAYINYPKSVIRLFCANILWNKSDHFSPWHSSSTLGSAHLA